jgi:prevent-host-death family protein
MKNVNIHDAKTHLSEMLAVVKEKGGSYVICKNGEPVADLVPHERRHVLAPHPVMSKIRLGYDPTEPLTADEWPEAD